ncbi:hypothetical protein AB2C36_33045, partial [Pseudomonas aeruginosa]
VRIAAQAVGEDGEAGLVQARLLQQSANGIVDDSVGRTKARRVAGQVQDRTAAQDLFLPDEAIE